MGYRWRGVGGCPTPPRTAPDRRKNGWNQPFVIFFAPPVTLAFHPVCHSDAYRLQIGECRPLSRYQKVSVEAVEVGMYVSELDRPWLETPFLFQGFHIRNQEEINALRDHCRHVVIDTCNEDDDAGAERPPPIPHTDKKSAEAMRGLKSEIKPAASIHVGLYSSVKDVMGELRLNGKLDVRKLEIAVEPMVDSVLRNPAAMSCLMRIRRKGGEIPVYGRIAVIVDTYDAMITSRPYASTQSSYGALRESRALAGVEFQAEIVDQFTQAIGMFPTGTLVLLNTGEVAVVTPQSRIRRLRPEVMIILDQDKKPLEDFRVVDLNQVTATADDQSSLWIESGLEPGAFGINPADYYLN